MYSGSGAVIDYLSGRNDLSDPLLGMEYLLPHAPHGLMALESVAGRSFHYSSSDRAVKEFRSLLRKLCRKSWRIRYGHEYCSVLRNFSSVTDEFMKSIIDSQFPVSIDSQGYGKNDISFPLYKLLRLFRFRRPPKTEILVGAEELVQFAKKMHDELFCAEDRGSPILLNQAGSGWNPVESTKYFNNRKVVLVTRDPRDQFAEIKLYKNARLVDEFICWYRNMMERISRVHHPDLLKIRFEEFVVSNLHLTYDICTHLCLNYKIKSSYSSSMSLSNIGKYKSVLSEREIKKIEDLLPDFIIDK